MSMTKNPENLPMWKKIVFAAGQFGWSLGGFSVGSLMNYFYFPPETAEGLVFRPFIFQGAVFGVLTILGLASGLGRVFDAFNDPWIAGVSDRLKNRFGRRRTFMAISALPTALLSVLVFTPPIQGISSVNAVWLVITVLLFYLSITAYTIPYTALIAELGHSSKDRLFLSTLTSVGWAMGFFIGNSVYALKDIFMNIGLSPEGAFRTVLIGFSLIGFIAMILPVIFIDENRYAHRGESKEKPLQAIVNSLKNVNFRILLASSFSYFLANTLLEAGIVYYVTILMGMAESMAFTLMAVMFILSFTLYPFIVKLANKKGKKQLLTIGFLMQAFVFFLIFLCGVTDGSTSVIIGWTAIFIQAIPSAITGILPNAMVSDIARADGIRTGSHKAASFFACNGFNMKLAVSAGNFLLPSFLLLGKSVDNPKGVIVSALFSAVVMAGGVYFLRKYDEPGIEKQLGEENPGDGVLVL